MTSQEPITGRLAILLAAIRRQGGEWTTRRVQRLYAQLPTVQPLRATARRDLAYLHQRGHLVLHETKGRRHYTSAEAAT